MGQFADLGPRQSLLLCMERKLPRAVGREIRQCQGGNNLRQGVMKGRNIRDAGPWKEVQVRAHTYTHLPLQSGTNIAKVFVS
mmetsp:Transcript_1421/g.8766  ORF Transcript_1421/g.8766 Transcript_1421/m.8766 type:complete len:82 (-) Transcript_1421:2414-2659(-)